MLPAMVKAALAASGRGSGLPGDAHYVHAETGQ
jgi:hypothetical protein